MIRKDFEHPVKQFARLPYAYTGTRWKLDNLSRSWQELVSSGKWENLAEINGVRDVELELRQLAVPVVEPNHFIYQPTLVKEKATAQAEVLVATLVSMQRDKYEAAEDELLIIPPELKAMCAAGLLSLAYISTDVQSRHRQAGRTWDPLRNHYVPEGLKKKSKLLQLRKEFDTYLAETYGKQEGEIFRAVDAGIGLTQVLWSRENKIKTRVFPAVSTVGFKLERSVLATERDRRRAIDWLIATYENDPMIRSKHHNPLAVTDNRAGGMKSEDVLTLARAEGVKTELWANEARGRDADRDFLDHAEGAPFHLLRALFLTLLTIKPAEYLAGSEIHHQYPRGAKRYLSV